MRITSIYVSCRETVSLPGYANATRETGLTAEPGHSQDPKEVHAILLRLCQERVHEELDDILEAAGEPPKFYKGPRYRAIECPALGVTAVLPDDDFRSLYGWYTLGRGFRLKAALDVAKKHSGKCLGLVNGMAELPRPDESKPEPGRVIDSDSDFCEDCNKAIGQFDPVHTLCDDCYQPEEGDGASPEVAPTPIEAEAASGIVCPKCDHTPAPGKIQLLCSEHEETTF